MNLTDSIVELYRKTSSFLPGDVKKELMKAGKKEKKPLAKNAMDSIIENIRIAEKKKIPLCGDTGIPVFFISHPKEFTQEEIRKSILKATAIATKKSFLRPNAVDSLTGKNSGKGTGEAIPSIYFQQCNSPFLKFDLLLKGGGSENVARTYSLPNEELNAERNLDGVRKCVLDAVVKAQGMGCPPSIISVAVGGSKDAIAIEAKKLFLEKLDKKNKNPKLALFEKELLEEINSLGIGPIGVGGNSTALALKTKFLSRHPATFFVEVAFSCWCDRRKSLEWKEGVTKYE